jgi:hypothetical protein
VRTEVGDALVERKSSFATMPEERAKVGASGTTGRLKLGRRRA